MKKILFSMLAISALVFSCKKDDDKSNSELIIGKWDLTATYTAYTTNNVVVKRDTIKNNSGAFVLDFRNNGTVIIKTTNSTDTADYKVVGSMILSEGDTVNISKLNGSEMQFHNKNQYDANSFYEEWPTYKKIN